MLTPIWNDVLEIKPTITVKNGGVDDVKEMLDKGFMVPIKETRSPDADAATLYRRQRAIFDGLYEPLEPTFRALHRLQPAIGMWIIAAPAPEARSFPAVASIVRDWLLVCPTDNDGLITGYPDAMPQQ